MMVSKETLQTISCPGGHCRCGVFPVEHSRNGHMSRLPHRWRRWEDTGKQKLTHGQPCHWRAAPHQFSPELPGALRSFWLSPSTPSLPPVGTWDRLKRFPLPRSWGRQSTSDCSRGDVTPRQLQRSEVNDLLLYVLKKAAAPSFWHFQLIIPGVTD